VEQIASGGELSRVMLALKATIEAGKKGKGGTQRTLVFDEIDTGIGGRAAEAVGKKLKVAGPCEPSAMHHAFAANRLICRSSYLIEKTRDSGANEDSRSAH